MRGKVRLERLRGGGSGITPAYAGKRKSATKETKGYEDHPRVCGEKIRGRGTANIWQGSPPRMRGKASHSGKTVVLLWDHPRVCGEKPFRQGKRPSSRGSPPRVRGKGLRAGITARGQGITPAYAGKRRPPAQSTRGARDHPRVCGEKVCMMSSMQQSWGSPPRVRGKEPVILGVFVIQGITPAYAGKSSRHQKRTAWEEDHPRVCGEKSMPSRTSSKTTGSPPRVRGKDYGLQHIAPDAGITPACAGKSQLVKAFQRRSWDHPRVCGEK